VDNANNISGKKIVIALFSGDDLARKCPEGVSEGLS
jgi:hypothetical protein